MLLLLQNHLHLVLQQLLGKFFLVLGVTLALEVLLSLVVMFLDGLLFRLLCKLELGLYPVEKLTLLCLLRRQLWQKRTLLLQVLPLQLLLLERHLDVLVGVGANLNRCNYWRRSADLARDLLLFLVSIFDVQLLNLAGFLVW